MAEVSASGDVQLQREPDAVSECSIADSVVEEENATTAAAGEAVADAATTRNIDDITESMRLMNIIARPDVGTLGRRIPCHSNFFELILRDPNRVVFQYHIDIHHRGVRILDRDENRIIFWRVIEENPTIFPQPFAIAYDGSQLMYTVNKLAANEYIDLKAGVMLPRESAFPVQCGTSFHFTGKLNMNAIKQSFTPFFSNGVVKPLQVLDIVLRQGLTCPLFQRSHMFSSFRNTSYVVPGEGFDITDLGGCKEMWSGFFSTAVVGSRSRPLLNVDVSHSVFFKPRLPIIELLTVLMNERFGRGQGNYKIHPDTKLSQNEVKILEENIKGLKVRCTYQEQAVRVYKVNSVKGPANVMSFTTKDQGSDKEITVTVADYFSRRYGPLKYPGLPCLHVGPASKNILIPMEVCMLDSPQKYTKKLTDKQTATVIKTCAVDTTTRENEIFKLCNKAGFLNDPFMKEFGISVNPQMVKLEGRVLDAPKIKYAAKQPVMVKDGVWNGERQKLFVPAQCHSYSLFGVCDPREQDSLQSFTKSLAKFARDMGMTWPDWPTVVRYGQTNQDVQDFFQELVNQYENAKQTCDLVIVVMPSKNNDLYMTIKEQSDIVCGVMSQCCLLRQIQRPGPAYLTNLLMKVNMKLGGINSRIISDQVTSKFLNEQACLVLGIDVTHPTQQEEAIGMPSVAAVVGNVDMLPQCFGANVKVQRRCRESVVYVTSAIRDRILAFQAQTSRFPERIIVYRDGVSEGQFAEVLREELHGIKAACGMIAADYNPPVTHIVVQKRHHARMFCDNPRDTIGRAKNIPPGTVFDTEVVSPGSFDFFLCSHFGIQGTSRPSRYHVLYDDAKFTADELQAITYNLCYTYGRCTRAVSIPSSVYYAHLVATRARTHLKRKIMNLQRAYKEKSRLGSTASLASTSSSGTRVTNNSRSTTDQITSKIVNETPDDVMQNFVAVTDNIRNRMYFV